MLSRSTIVNIARTHIDTPFHHQGRVKGRNGGVDCAGLLASIANEIHYPYTDVHGYSRTPDGKTLMQALRANLNEIDIPAASIGDVLVFWMSHRQKPQHVGIISHPGMIIHTYADVEKVTENDIDDFWQKRIYSAFRFRGVE